MSRLVWNSAGWQSWPWVLFLGLAFPQGGCANTPLHASPTAAVATDGTPQPEVGPSTPASLGAAQGAELREALSGFSPESVNPLFLSLTLGRQSMEFRLVGTSSDHPALLLLRQRAGRLAREGFGSERVDLESFDAAIESVGALRERIKLAESPVARERLRSRLRKWAVAAELHAWRIATHLFEEFQLTRVAGGWSAFQDELLADPRDKLARLEPPVPSYHAISSALDRYTRLAKRAAREGGVRPSPSWGKLRPGVSDSLVLALRRRLELEGFASPNIGPAQRFDAGLVRALRTFQAHHSLEENGKVDAPTLAALSISLDERVQQLQAILEHLRGTPYYRSRSRIVVNVPGFYLEYFRDGRLVSRHRTVVGAIRVGRDGRVLAGGRINETPLLSGALTFLVLNPSWHVPKRIKEELDRLAAKNPGFYDAYRLYVDDRGNERVVQPPGPDSALGRVKMAFSNNLGIFLHDTPHKDLFQRTVRAYSHGCVRVENATDLARNILDDDPQTMSAQQATQLLRTYFETPVQLTRPIEVHIEYVTAGTNEAGDFRFFPDLYQLGPVKRARVP